MIVFKVGDKVINGKGQIGVVKRIDADGDYPVVCLILDENEQASFTTKGTYWLEYRSTVMDIRKLTKLEKALR